MSRGRRWMAGALAAVAVVAIVAAVAWSARNGIARWLAIRQLEAMTGRPTAIDRVDVNLGQGRLSLAGLRVADLAPGPPLAELDRLDVRLDLGALLRGHLWIRDLSLGGARVRIVRSEQGEFNVAGLLKGSAPREGSSALSVDRLTLSDGAVFFEDRARAPVHTWRAEGIAMELSGISTQSDRPPGTGRMTATVAGAPLTVEVAELRLAPLHLVGRMALTDMDATLAGAFLPAGTGGVLERARLSAEVAASIDARDGARIDARGRLDDLALRSRRTGDPLVSVPSVTFTVDGASIDPSGRGPHPGRVEMTGGATLFDARGSSAGRLDIERMRLLIESAGGPTPSSARLVFTARLAGGGELDVQGPFGLAPLGAELRIHLMRLDPTVLASYAALPVGLAGVVDGDLTVDLASAVASDAASGFGGAAALVARVRGRATVSRAAVAGGGQQVVVARQVEIDGVDAQWPRIAIARIRVVQPIAVVERDRTGRILLAARLAVSRETGDASGASARGPAPSGPTVEIGEIAVDEGTLTLDDATAVPPARLTVSRLRMSARSISWPARGPATISVQAATPGAGTLEVTGTVSLDPLRLDVRARLAGAALAPYQGYVPFPARVQGLAHADLAVAGSLTPAIDITARGTASVSELAMADGDRPVLRVARIETTGLEYRWPSVLTVDRLNVRGGRLRVVRRADGAFPLRAVFTPARQPPGDGERSGSAPASGASPRATSVTIREALLEESRARLVDESVSPATSVDLSGVRLVARSFTWPARDPLPIDLQMRTPDGGSASARGALDLAGGGADLKLTLNAVDLSPARPYLPVSGRMTGKATAELDVKARLEPLSIAAHGTASLADVALAEGGEPIISAARVDTTGFDYAWPARIAIERLHVQAPRVAIERRRDGTLPIVSMLVGPAARTSPAAPVAAGAASEPEAARGGGSAPFPLDIAVRESVFADASATVTDATVRPAARVALTGMRLVARDFTWPSRGATPVELRVPTPGGGMASAIGYLGQGLTRLELDLTLTGVDVAAARPYLPVRGRIAGNASCRLALNATFAPLAITARGTASLANLAVVDGERRLLTAEHAEATGLDYAWPATVSIDRLGVRKPWALIDRVAGKLPVLDALATTAPPPRREPLARSENRGAARPRRAVTSAGAAGGPSEALRLSVRQSVVEDGSATIVDDGTKPPARLEITGAQMVVRDFAWPARGPMDIELRAAAPQAGTLDVSGQLHLDASTIDAKVTLDRVDVAALHPFVPVRARFGGKANADLRVKGSLVPLALTATGKMAVADAALGDGQRSLVTAKRIDLTGLTAQWPRRRAVIERIVVREPWALVERDDRGTLPLLSLLAPEPPKGPAPPAASGSATVSEGDAPHVEVGALAIEEGFVRFTDRATSPAFVEEASRLTVTARALGTAPSTRSDVAVASRLTGGAQVELRGLMGPLVGPLFADVQGELSGLALRRVNPYVNSLVGWVARQGSVSGTTHFRIHNDRLEADNEIVIGQPLFVPSRRGDEVRERVGVPLDLLVSLLEDSRREVRLSVPVTGSLSSREFDFGDAVWEAIRKAAIKVLALPVSWIGKIFYTADARIDSIAIWPVYFEAGTTRIQKEFDAHAERLAAFMSRTPAIVYALKPVMAVADVQALKRDAVRQRIDAMARAAGQADTAAAVARLFAERFPGRPVPAALDAALDELAGAEPAPDEALRALAASRLALTRRLLESKGVDGARLRTQDGAVPVEASGAGRVEFEMIPDAAETGARG